MMKKLPQKNFQWLTKDDIDSLDPLAYEDSSDYGTVVEVIVF